MEKITIQHIHNQYNIFDDNIKVSVIQQYNKTTKQWKFSGFRCMHCDNIFKTAPPVQKHQSICKELNTIKKRRVTEMPIQVITVKGERMYRWGDSGKLYKDRADAEKQAAAAYASGYKEPKKDMKDKK